MKLNLIILFVTVFSINAVELPQYEAKYKFESEEINITGIRKFNKNSEGYEIEFQASNLFAGMNFSSLFDFENYKVIPKSYDVKIKPKFLDRDQFIKFDYMNNQIVSTGSNKWSEIINKDLLIMDPLNVQIMIRTLVKENKTEFSLNIVDMQKGGFKDPLNKIPASLDVSLVDLKLRNNKIIYWLATENFFAITKYNRSYKYAAAVLELAEALQNKSKP